MSALRDYIETLFEKFSNIIWDNKYKTLFLIIIMVMFLAFQLPKATIDTSLEGFLHENDHSLVDYRAFKDQFGRDEIIIIVLEPANVFDFNFLEHLKKLHYELKDKTPFLADITSLINARNTYGENNELIVDDLMEHWPKSNKELEVIKKRALENPIYKNLILSEDGRLTTIIIETDAYSASESGTLDGFDAIDGFEPENTVPIIQNGTKKKYLTGKENSQVVQAVEEILNRHNIPDTKIYFAGVPNFTHYIKDWMIKDMSKFMGIAVLTIIFFLAIMFRRITGIFLPLVVVILSLVCTIGLMVATGTTVKLHTQILPSFLLAVGVGASVHILVIFFRHFNIHHNKKNAIAFAMRHSGLAVLMTSVTTAAGLLSFATADVAPIADVGIFAAAGIMFSFVFTVTLLPALLAIIPIKPSKVANAENGQIFHISSPADRLLVFVGKISINHPWRIIIISTLLLIWAIIGITKVRFYHNPIIWFPETSKIRIDTEIIDEKLRGSTSLEVVVDTGKENGLYDPDILNRLDESGTYMESLESGEIFIGKAWSITSILKEINRALHNNDYKFYSIPQDKQLIAQELLLFENTGSDDLEDVTDSRFSKARITMKVPFVDFVAFEKFCEKVTDYFVAKFPDSKILVTGMAAILVKVEINALLSLAKSYVYALIIITILMIILIGRVRIGMLSMIPNILPIVITVGGMGWFGIQMDLFNMLIGSIAIGLAVDDTIHFMHNFRRYFEQSGNAQDAVIQTLLTTGRAMFVTSCVLSIGFFILMLANMNNMICFGKLTGMAILLAFLADFFLAPALMIVVNKKKQLK